MYKRQVWMQELDLQKRCLVGERKTLAYGHAANAKYAEGPPLYKIGDHYLLLMAEGGSDYNLSLIHISVDRFFRILQLCI